jgi:hypothetical protein
MLTVLQPGLAVKREYAKQVFVKVTGFVAATFPAERDCVIKAYSRCNDIQRLAAQMMRQVA